MSLDEEGNILIDHPVGELKDKRPVSYLDKNGNKWTRKVLFPFCQNDDGENILQFPITDSLDFCHPLISNPGHIYSSFRTPEN